MTTPDGKWSVRDTLTGTLYPQPNKLIAEKVAEMHGHSEVVAGWAAEPTKAQRKAARKAVEHAMTARSYDEHAYDRSIFKEGVRDIADAALDAAKEAADAR